MPALAGAAVTLAMRPEAATIGTGQTGDLVLTGKIVEVQFQGSIIRITADVGGQPLTLDQFNRTDVPPPAIGSETSISLPASSLVVLVA